MRSRTGFVVCRTRWDIVMLSFTGILVLMYAVPLFAQNCPTNDGVRTICKQIDNAEVVSVTSPFGAYPTLQPVVYWHDENWKLDMLPGPTPEGEVSMRITPREGREKIVKFPTDYAQVDSISRAPNDKAIIIADINGKTTAFGLVDLKSGKLIDNFAISAPSLSPNRRFVLYVNTDYYDYYNYHFYDTLKTPRENTCGYRLNDPEHKDLDESYRGIQVYPRRRGQVSCSDADLKEFENDDHNMVSSFVWSADSSKAVFADVMNGSTISLILVTMHDGDRDKEHEFDHDREHDKERDLPRTFVYSFTGAENVCAGAASCNSNNVRSVAWNGDSVNVALVQANPTGPAIVKNLTIPLSKFVPTAK